jgi:lipoate-protein ligase A
MEWVILETATASASENMRLDAELLESLQDNPILHFYDWERDSATYGYFVSPEEYLNLEEVKLQGWDLARRPTGGGIVFHKWDMAFSVLVPASSPHFSKNTLDNYAFVNAAVLRAVSRYLEKSGGELTKNDMPSFDGSCQRFCMAKPTQYDVVLHGRKIAGAAQRQRRQGFLHQGIIALAMPQTEILDRLLLPGTRVREAMLAHTCPLLGERAGEEEMNRAKLALKTLLITELTR